MTPLEAMKQAIDALEDAMSYFAYPMYRKQCADLQKALEEMEKAKPVAYLYSGWQLLTPNEVEERNKEYDRNFQEYDEQVPLYLHPAPAIPEGWQLVPKSTTCDMDSAGSKAHYKNWDGSPIVTESDAESIYKAMLAAAPKHMGNVKSSAAEIGKENEQ